MMERMEMDYNFEELENVGPNVSSFPLIPQNCVIVSL